ncbi:MAG: zinc-dependent metalloprotease [Actinomycetales bacterium]|nr:zinc-dependent metalloprotease [Actinomycetales bacterium]
MSGDVPFGFGMPGPGQPGQGPFDMSALGAALQQLGQYLQQAGTATAAGPVNWALVRETARAGLAGEAAGFTSAVTEEARGEIVDACRLADLWLDAATTFPASAATAMAWSRADWLEATLPMWRRYVEPVAERMVAMMGTVSAGDLGGMPADALQQALPEGLREMLPEGITPDMMAMLQPMLGMMQQLAVAAFSVQLGQGLAALSREVVSAGDIGIPLQESEAVALIPANVRGFGEGIGIDETEIRLYLALRESAHQRLFAHVPWLRARLSGAIEAYARGIRVDAERMQQAVAEIDMSDPQALQHLVGSGLLQPEDTDEQRAALARLETLLALVEGWVEDVVAEAIGERLATAQALRETVRRRRASGGPAERTFAGLIGLELRPKAIREAATLFAAVRVRGGASARDGLWEHPDLMPDADDLADPLSFADQLGLADQPELPGEPGDDDLEPGESPPA